MPMPFIGPRLKNGRTRTNVKRTTTTTTKVARRGKKKNYSDNQVFRTKQVLAPFMVQNDVEGVAGHAYGLYTKLTDVEQRSTFTSLFDQYRIDKVVYKFIPRAVPTSLANVDDAQLLAPPTYWYSAIDKDDANAITAAAIREHGNCRTHTSNGKTITISFRPHVAIAGFGGAFTQYMNSKSMWIDCASPDVQHYGLKVVTPGTGNALLNNTIVYDVFPTLYLSFKHVR